MTTKLATRQCTPCHKDTQPLKGDDLKPLQEDLGPGWKVVEEHHLEKEFEFPDFKNALNFTWRIGQTAEEEGHHPDITLSWGKVGVRICTHNIGGLSENDFILAAKIDEVKRVT